jgi:PAS domain S-box-containing protein
MFLGIYIYNSSYNAVVDRTSNQLTSVREFKKHQVEMFFKDRLRDLQFLQKSFHFNDLSVQSIDDQQVIQILLKSDYYSFVSYYSQSTGKLDIITKDSTAQSQVTELNDSAHIFSSQLLTLSPAKKTVISDYKNIFNTPTLLVSAACYDAKGTLVGLVSLGIPCDVINKLIFVNTSLSGMGYSGESYIVGSDYLMRSQSRFDSNSVMKKVVKTAQSIDAFKAKNGVKKDKDYRNIDVLSSYSYLKIQDLKWALLVEIDLKELINPVHQQRNDILTIIALVSIVVLILAFFISYKITVPLVNLSKVALEISFGKYGKTLPVTSNDEIGELTESFNLMSTRIKEQTSEIIEREKRLDRFYEATKDGIIIHDLFVPLLVNKGLAKLTLYSIEALMEMRITDILFLKEHEIDYVDVDKSYTFETMCFRKDGTFFHVEIKKNPILYEGKRVNSTVIHDITDRVLAQLALNQERQKQLSSFIDGQENERKRVSRELHDGLGQSLIAIKMRLESIDVTDSEKTASTIELTKSFVESTIDEVRRMSNNLMPSSLVEFGIVTALRNLVEQSSVNSAMTITFDHKSVPKNLDEKIQMYLFRITQEAIHNSVKHAEATMLQILLLCEDKSLILLIEDNGKGFQGNHATLVKGNGLYHMRERVQMLKGTIDFTSNTNKGLTIHIKIPI